MDRECFLAQRCPGYDNGYMATMRLQERMERVPPNAERQGPAN